jgi:ABC-2 type transport system permease protein
MKFWDIVRFELAYQGRRAWPWSILAVLLVLSFLVARDTSVESAGSRELLIYRPLRGRHAE